MITQMKWGAMYGRLEEGDVILRDPVQLGGHTIAPDAQITRIGSKRRSMFEMREGFWLEYAGKIGSELLFISKPTGCNGDPWYYVFSYVDQHTLLCLNAGNGSGWDIGVDEVVFRSSEEVVERGHLR